MRLDTGVRKRLLIAGRSDAKTSARRASRGFSTAELLVTLAIVGLITALGAGAWSQYRRATSLSTSVNTIKRMLNQARLRAIYQGVSHFVILDTQQRTIAIYEDTSLPSGGYDSGDDMVQREQLPNSVILGMPDGVSSMPSPLGSGTLTTAWSFPLPGSMTGLNSNSMALMLNPTGQVMSTEDTANVIGFGAMVFNDSHAENGVISIGIEGRSGTIRSYRFDGTTWKGL